MTIDQHNTGVSLNPYTTVKYHCAKTPLRQNSLFIILFAAEENIQQSMLNTQFTTGSH